MKTKVKILLTGYVVILLVMVPIAFAQWSNPPVCSQRLYNNNFDNGLLGWRWEYPAFGFGRLCQEITDPFSGIRVINGILIIQNITLPAGEYHFNVQMLLENNSMIRPGGFGDILLGDCNEIDPGEWQGEHWGQIRLFWKNSVIAVEDIPNGLPHDTYHLLSIDFMLPTGDTSDFKIQLWSPAYCSVWHNESTKISYDWVSLCQVPQATWTPTVTGTPPDTATPTTTPTVFCESTDYPTGTPYPTQTIYPTATDWITPPVYLTPTYPPTYTPYPTCVPTVTKTPYASATPFHFGVPLTYTNQFEDLKEGMEQFFDSTGGLIGDVSGILISASQAVSDVTSFGITSTITISGTPVTTTSMVETFTENMDALRYVFGWFGIFRSIAPAPFWFLLLCIVWTVFVLAFKYVSVFFTTVLWPLIRTIWDVIIDIWNSIPFI